MTVDEILDLRSTIGAVVGAVAFVVLVIWFVVVWRSTAAMMKQMKAEQAARRARFADRPVLSEEEWMARHFPRVRAARAEFCELLAKLGKEVETDWTRFHPDDRFSRELQYSKVIDDEIGLTGFEVAFEDWLKKWKIDREAVPWDQIDRLGDFIERMNELFVQREHRVPRRGLLWR